MPLCVFFPVVTMALSIPVTIFCLVACFLQLSLRGQDPDTGLPTYPDITLTYEDTIIAGNQSSIFPDPVPLKALLAYQVFGWLWTYVCPRTAD